MEVLLEAAKLLIFGAGDGTRTRDVQLGKSHDRAITTADENGTACSCVALICASELRPFVFWSFYNPIGKLARTPAPAVAWHNGLSPSC